MSLLELLAVGFEVKRSNIDILASAASWPLSGVGGIMLLASVLMRSVSDTAFRGFKSCLISSVGGRSSCVRGGPWFWTLKNKLNKTSEAILKAGSML